MENESSTKRLNKFISETGYCSRREADKLVEEGRVKINGIIPALGTKVSKDDQVTIDDVPLKIAEKLVYLAFNKPVGVTCTTDLKDKDNIVEFVNYPTRVFPIGRLDKPSEGLIFLTNDGDIVNKILRAGNNHEKEYLVTVDKPVTPEFIEKMANGVKILETVTKKCKVTQESKFQFRIILTQGLNRQIRRMCEVFGFKVTKLERVRIMNITLEGIPKGKFRPLTASEMDEINGLVQHSIKTEEASTQQEEME